VPLLGHAFKGVDPSILEADTGARHQILHGRGDDHLIGAGKRGQAGRDGDGDAAHVVAEQLNLAGVQACPDMQAQPPATADHPSTPPWRSNRRCR